MIALSETIHRVTPRRSLGARLIFWMVVASTCLSILASGVQLFFSYQRDLSNTHKTFNLFEQSFHSSLTTALWEFNFRQIGVILDGLAANPDVVHVALTSTTGQSFERGKRSTDPNMVVRSLSLDRIAPDGTKLHLGELSVGITFSNAQKRLWSQFQTLLYSNMIKTGIASAVMLILFYMLVARHLRRIAQFLRGYLPGTAGEKLSLQRTESTAPDELDLVVEAVNDAQDRAQVSYETFSQLNQELDRSNLELKRSNEELQRFAFVAAHDLQEPARKIKTFGGLLIDEYGPMLEGDGRKYVDFMVSAAGRQHDLVKDLLVYSKVDAQDDHMETVDLDDVLRATLDDLSIVLEETGGKVETSALPTVMASRSQMKQVFSNLIGNALKYRSSDRAPLVVVRAETFRQPGDSRQHHRISVEDNGIGFDEKYAEEIFEPFKRLHTYARLKGTGIGLAIVRKIVFHHGGTISATSRSGQGSVFVLTLPA